MNIVIRVPLYPASALRRLWCCSAALAACMLLHACGSNAQYERNQRAIDEQMLLGNSSTDNARAK